MDVLVVCTANICRSPLAAAMLRREADRRIGPGAIAVSSAGVRGIVGESVPREMRHAAAAHDLDLSDHRGATVSFFDLDHPDLVLTMSERQRDFLAAQAPEVEGRLFTLKELARLARHVAAPPDGLEPTARVREAVALAHRGRPLVPGPEEGGEENVADPYGKGPEAYAATVEEVAGLVGIVADFVFGP